MLKEIFDFFNQGWVGSLIGVVGVVFGIVGLFSFKIARSTAKPSYQKSSIRLLGREEDKLPDEVKVSFKGKEVERLTKTTIVLWNDGTEVLGKEDMVETSPVSIEFESGVNILSYKINKYSKESNKFELYKSDGHDNRVIVDFLYMDPKDGVTIELLHDSESRYPEVNGIIKGLPKGFEDLGKVSIRNKSKLKFPLNILFGNPKPIYFTTLFFGLALIALWALPNELTKSIVNLSLTPGQIELDYMFLILGSTYTVLPAIALWFGRIKFPKYLVVDEVEP